MDLGFFVFNNIVINILEYYIYWFNLDLIFKFYELFMYNWSGFLLGLSVLILYISGLLSKLRGDILVWSILLGLIFYWMGLWSCFIGGVCEIYIVMSCSIKGSVVE